MTVKDKKELIFTKDELRLFPPQAMYARCDRCNARSKVMVMIQSSKFLAFCNHHFKQHSDALAQMDALVKHVKEDENV